MQRATWSEAVWSRGGLTGIDSDRAIGLAIPPDLNAEPAEKAGTHGIAEVVGNGRHAGKRFAWFARSAGPEILPEEDEMLLFVSLTFVHRYLSGSLPARFCI